MSKDVDLNGFSSRFRPPLRTEGTRETVKSIGAASWKQWLADRFFYLREGSFSK